MNEMHKQNDVCTCLTFSQTYEIITSSVISGGIQRSIIYVTNTFYTIALLCTCRRFISAQIPMNA
jgi:hypothetical protein